MVVESPSSHFRTPSHSVSQPVTGYLRESPWTDYFPSEKTGLEVVEGKGNEEEEEEKRGAKSAFGQFAGRSDERRTRVAGESRCQHQNTHQYLHRKKDNRKEGLDWDAATV